jgi:Amt family ammonium transporter
VNDHALNGADTAWVLASAALVILMTPGLAFFYGGMVRAKNVLNMMMMCLSAIPVVWVLWMAFGYSMSFGEDLGWGLLGDPTQFSGLRGLFAGQNDPTPAVGTIPALVFVVFQAGFAMITVALIAGAVADRMRFTAWIVFTAVWCVVVYFPVAHWVFCPDNLTASRGGWIINHLKALDFAGGTAVEINSGISGLALALVLGKRRNWPKDPMRPHNLPAVMLGAGLLWFGWFGFNAGSSLKADGIAALALANTLAAGAVSLTSWLIVERVRHGKPTSFGAASGAVAGLVAITPSCAYVTPAGALAIGVVAGAVSSVAIEWKYKLGYDDSLDVVGVHLVGGLVGTIMIGLVASKSAGASTVDGLFYGGGFDQLWRQIAAALAVLVYALAATLLIGFALKAVMRLRAHPQDEAEGLDETEHAESAYDFSAGRGGRVSSLE